MTSIIFFISILSSITGTSCDKIFNWLGMELRCDKIWCRVVLFFVRLSKDCSLLILVHSRQIIDVSFLIFSWDFERALRDKCLYSEFLWSLYHTFGLDTRKYGLEQLRIRTLFTQWRPVAWSGLRRGFVITFMIQLNKSSASALKRKQHQICSFVIIITLPLDKYPITVFTF